MAVNIKNLKTDILIVGAGPAGLTAGLYSGRSGVKTVILEGRAASRLGISYTIENYPGFPAIESRELLEKFRRHALMFGAEIIAEDAVAFGLDLDPKYVTTKDMLIEAGAVILATGKPLPRERLIPGEERLIGQGVSYCATCDGPLFRGQTVIAVGGAGEALEEIRLLAQMGCRPVWVPDRKAALDEGTVNGLKAAGVEVVADGRVREIAGQRRVEKVLLERAGRVEEVKAAAVFVFREMATGLLFSKAGIELDHRQCVAVDRFQRTNIPGVFAAGDVTCGGLQVVAAAGEGCVAALQALAYLRSRPKPAK